MARERYIAYRQYFCTDVCTEWRRDVERERAGKRRKEGETDRGGVIDYTVLPIKYFSFLQIIGKCNLAHENGIGLLYTHVRRQSVTTIVIIMITFQFLIHFYIYPHLFPLSTCTKYSSCRTSWKACLISDTHRSLYISNLLSTSRAFSSDDQKSVFRDFKFKCNTFKINQKKKNWKNTQSLLHNSHQLCRVTESSRARACDN